MFWRPLLSGSAAAQGERLARIGVVSLHAPDLARDVNGIREELRNLDYLEGEMIEIRCPFQQRRQATGEGCGQVVRRAPVRLQRASWTTPTVQLGKEENRTIPMVMIASDPVAAKLVQSLPRPGGNIMGLDVQARPRQRLELLREIKLGIGTIAFLGYAPSPGAPLLFAKRRRMLTRLA